MRYPLDGSCAVVQRVASPLLWGADEAAPLFGGSYSGAFVKWCGREGDAWSRGTLYDFYLPVVLTYERDTPYVTWNAYGLDLWSFNVCCSQRISEGLFPWGSEHPNDGVKARGLMVPQGATLLHRTVIGIFDKNCVPAPALSGQRPLATPRSP